MASGLPSGFSYKHALLQSYPRVAARSTGAPQRRSLVDAFQALAVDGRADQAPTWRRGEPGDSKEEKKSPSLAERVTAPPPRPQTALTRPVMATPVAAAPVVAVPAATPAAGAAAAPAPLAEAKAPAAVRRPVLVVKNAHLDDIHGMISVGPETFVTGSKDCYLKLWNASGKLVKEVFVPEKRDYKEWITALTRFGTNQWISGTRNGIVDLWDSEGNYVSSLEGKKYLSEEAFHKCKFRNLNRISCIAQSVTAATSQVYYVGGATQFRTQKVGVASSLDFCKTSGNDWVYCIHPLTEKRFLVVTGARLDLWNRKERGRPWHQTPLITEVRAADSTPHQRPFISSIQPLDGQANVFGVAVFGGQVRIIDIVSQTILREYHEHVGRVWQIENLRPQVFASCADDRTIKIWDDRLPASVLTIGGSIGRVSTLLRLNAHSLVSGACPDELRTATETANLSFWDIRQLG